MPKRLPLLCAALLALAACSHGGDEAPTAPAPTSTSTTAVTPAPASSATVAPTDTTLTPAASDSAPAPAASVPAETTSAQAAAAPAKPFVQDDKWVEGKNYFLIQPQQPKVGNTSKIEVVEAFSFGCPVCFRVHDLIDQLAASLPADAQMDYLPAAFRPDENWPMYQQAFYAAQALGIERKSHDAMFNATWKSGETATYDLTAGKPKPKSQWPTIQTMAKFYSKYGVKPEEFVATANSFAVKMKMKRADDLIKQYGVDGTPTIIVDGKYRFDGTSAGGFPQMIELAQYLVSKEAAGR